MKKTLMYILIFLSYFSFCILFEDLLSLFNIITVLICTGYILFLIFVYRKNLKTELNDFKENYKTYLPKYILIYLFGILLMFLVNFILSKVTNQALAGNEAITREYIKKYPIYMTFSALIFSPLVEELIFRKTLKNIFKSKYLFIILSGFIFGILHIANYTNPTELLFTIPYIIMGIDFAYIYYKTNNIFTTLTFHFCHNLILLIIQFIK